MRRAAVVAVTVRRWHAALAWVADAARSGPGGADGRLAARVLLEADGERLVAVMPDVDPPADAVHLPGLTVPGFANAHSHAFHRALRGRTQGGAAGGAGAGRAPGDFWTWRERMYAVAARLDPDRYHALARAAYAEMALAGITAVGEFHYLHRGPGGVAYAEPNAMGSALVAAAADAGVRLTLVDACYLHGGFADGGYAPLDGVQRRFGDGDAERWAERAGALVEGPGVRVGAAIHSVRAVDPASMAVVRDWAAARGAPLHVHLSEQRAENAACVAATGLTPTALLGSVGALGPRTTAVHATHLEPADVAALGGSGTAVCLCPTTERDLADGVGPARALADAGSPLCLGSDSHAVVDPFEEARGVELDERLATERRGHHRPESLLEAATTAGGRALGWELGLRAGALADFAVVDLASVRTAGATPATAVAHVVFAATAADVTDVVVGGRPVVTAGRHAGVGDVGRALAAAIAVLGIPQAPAEGPAAARAPVA